MKTPKSESQNFLKSDRFILLLCIGFSLIFWLFIKLSKTFTTKSEVSIEYLLPSSKVFEEKPTTVVTPTYTGTGWDLIAKSIRKTDHKIYIELTEKSQQSFSQLDLRRWIDQFLPNKDIEISSINYDQINVSLIDKHSKKVPIAFQQEITFKDTYGYYRDSVQLKPDSVTITGPKPLLDSLELWSTQTIALEDVDQKVALNVDLKVPQAHNIDIEPKLTEVFIPVEQFTEKSFLVDITVANSPEDSLKIFPKHIKLSCLVGLSNYDKLQQTDFKVGIDLKDVALNNENNTLPISIFEAPSLIKNVKINPTSVEFFIVQDTLITQKK